MIIPLEVKKYYDSLLGINMKTCARCGWENGPNEDNYFEPWKALYVDSKEYLCEECHNLFLNFLSKSKWEVVNETFKGSDEES